MPRPTLLAAAAGRQARLAEAHERDQPFGRVEDSEDDRITSHCSGAVIVTRIAISSYQPVIELEAFDGKPCGRGGATKMVREDLVDGAVSCA